ncbi:MAG: hypothetical protein HY063_04985 [Bacteroidetes bacterium]|nr:hypothetical protein [Bacteroidota bacterium]
MIRFLKHNEIDKIKWDECIEHSVNNLIYACSWYLDIVCPNWNCLIEDDYKSVMPLTARKKYGIEYLYPPYFAQQLGVFSTEKLSKEKVEEFLKEIPSQYKFMEMYLNTQNTFDPDSYRDSGFQIKKNINIELDLNSSYEILRKNFSEDTKRNIKKSEKHKITFRKNIPPQEIISIFRKNTGKKITNLTDKNYKVLLNLINTCIKKGYAETRGGFTGENKLCAGIVWLIKNNRAIFLFSATNAEAKKNGGMFFLIDQFIQQHSGKEMTLDFEGSNLPGLARFYKGFGSKENVYLQIRKNNLSKLVRWLKG